MRLAAHLGMLFVVVLAVSVASGSAGSGAAQVAGSIVHTQDIWVLLEAGGDDRLVDQALTGNPPDRSVDLSGGFTFTELPSLRGYATAAGGAEMSHISITGGLLTAIGPDGAPIRALTVFSTARIGDGRPNLREGDRVSVGLEGLPPTGALTYALLQARMPEDPASETGMDGLEILVRRWTQRSLQVLGSRSAGVDLVETPLLTAENAQSATLKRTTPVVADQAPTGIPGLTWDPKPSTGLPRAGGVVGGFAEVFNRLGETVGFVDRQGARDYNDWLQSICTPECEFRLSGEITSRESHWEFRSTFGNAFTVGRSTANAVQPRMGDTYGERATNIQDLPCTINPSVFEGPFEVRGRYDARNRRLLLQIDGSQPQRGDLYRYECPRDPVLTGVLADVETPPTTVRRFNSANSGKVIEFEVCDDIDRQPLMLTFGMGGSTGEARITVTWLRRGAVITGVFGIPCQRGGPALVSP